jgi:DNA repair exonuclease SbcCD ATPase subunit
MFIRFCLFSNFLSNITTKKSFITLLLILGLQSPSIVFAADGSEFVLSALAADTKKRSRNELKEEIGQKIKQASQAATQLLQQLGKLQQDWGKQLVVATKAPSNLQQRLQESGALHTACGAICLEVAALQRTYTAAIEKLIENQKPFKKAGRGDLSKTLAILTNTCQQLQSSARAITYLQTSVVTVDSGRVVAVAKRLEQEQVKVHALVVSGQQDGCLKLV